MPGKQTIIDLENKFWQSIVDKDVEAAIALMPDKSVVTNARGLGVLGPDDYRAMAKQATGSMVLKSYSFDDVKVTFPSDDVAIIAYKATSKMDVDGKPVTLTAFDATTWVKTDGKWLAALHTESPLGDPMGQQKKAA